MTFMTITNPKVHFMQFSQHGVLVSSQRKSEDTLAASFPPLHSFHFIPFTGVTSREKPKSSFMQPFQHGDLVSFPNKREDAPAAFLSHTFVSHPLNHQHYTKTERQKQATEGTRGFGKEHLYIPACLVCCAPEKKFPVNSTIIPCPNCSKKIKWFLVQRKWKRERMFPPMAFFGGKLRVAWHNSDY
ncbi:hypothetical protein E4T38_06767 [Aureobasidium subglaciale]|nr:hypothetical protein E4T38_06767 [Aureobasidium subglaciale]KAI5222472.1 hypothetical protein E4T41_06618 [Aureobasidium subglaciale]KAI5223363.1 hypothetical protein E4T40_04534 [Aureobasidium subglaciale]KAI5259926.1 hypothetical protein E4T46_06505 [Aureobasidium subglaciale]